MAAAKASASAVNATTPDEYTAKFATLSFALKGADLMLEDSWQTLPGIKGKPIKNNVGPVFFQYGLTITQGNKKKVSYSVKWTGVNISDARVTRGPEEGDDYYVSCMTSLVSSLSSICLQVEATLGQGVLETTGDEEQAGQLPLARQHEIIKHLRLAIEPHRLTSVGGTQARTTKDFISHLRVHLTGNAVLNRQDRSNQPLKVRVLTCISTSHVHQLPSYKSRHIDGYYLRLPLVLARQVGSRRVAIAKGHCQRPGTAKPCVRPKQMIRGNVLTNVFDNLG